MKSKKCRVCGSEFTPNSSRQLDCNRTIEKICEVCGKPFPGKCSKNDMSRTCSKECHDILVERGKASFWSKETRTCVLCGEKFHPRNNKQLVCEKPVHTKVCEVCGKEFEVTVPKSGNLSDIRRTCSKECSDILKFIDGNPFADAESRKAALAKYAESTGYAHPMQNPEVVKKLKETNLERHGNEVYTRTEEYKEKRDKTNLERYGKWPTQTEQVKARILDTVKSRYGVDNVSKSPDIQARFRKKYLEKTGYDHPAKNPEIIARRQATNLERYGSIHAWGSPDVIAKVRSTMLERYGVINPMQNEELRAKALETVRAKYGVDCYLCSPEARNASKEKIREAFGVDHYSQTDDWKLAHVKDPTKYDVYKEYFTNPPEFLDKYFPNTRPSIRELCNLLGVESEAVLNHASKFGCQSRIAKYVSSMEQEVVSYLLSVQPDMEIVFHNRKLISPYEIDIYLPEYNIGIECNPTVTHNSSKPYIDSKILPYNYHQMKSDMCEAIGLQLIHIFGYEWKYRRSIIESMLRNVVHGERDVVYARKTEVRTVSYIEAGKFLTENHRQGNVNSKIRLGLYQDEVLVAIMTFSHVRHTIGKYTKDSETYELSRFCSRIGTSVVGGASKLFKHFIDTYHPRKVISYSDRAHTSGHLYMVLGFMEVRRSSPGYVWVDMRTERAYHRANAQKRNIRNFLKDDTIDLSKTEREIMTEHGYVQVFDSGVITWEWQPCIET